MDIVEELRQNREAGARRLESEYKVGLVSFARRLCANPSDAEELVNRTFAAVIEGIDDYLEQSAFFGWMCKIMMNINAADHRRRADRDVVYPGDLPDVADDDALESITRHLDASLVRDAIETLPKEMKEAIVMHYLMEQPIGRVAKVLALPVSTVKWRLHCAREVLAAKLGAAAKKPEGKALLAVIALCAFAAAGAAGVAAIRAATAGNAECTMQNAECTMQNAQCTMDDVALAVEQGTGGQPSSSQALQPTSSQTVKPSNQQEQEEPTMNKRSLLAASAALLAAGMPIHAVGDANLPDAYLEVEWLTSKGAQSVFDTGYVFTNRPLVKTTAMMLSGANLDIAGTAAKAAGCFIVGYNVSGNKVRYHYSNATATTMSYSPSVLNRWVDYEWGATVKHDGVTVGTVSSYDFSSNTQTFQLFGAETAILSSMKAVEMYDGDELVRKYIPCIERATRRIGVYDAVEGTFLPVDAKPWRAVRSVGAPAGIVEAEYIESEGAEYVDTEYVFKDTPRVELSYCILSFGETSGSAESHLMGATGSSFVIVNSGGSYTYRHGPSSSASSVEIPASLVAGRWYDCSFGTNVVQDGVTLATVSPASFADNNEPFNLFTFNPTKVPAIARIRSVRMYDGDALVRDLMPCYCGSFGEFGFLDKVGGRFYPSAGRPFKSVPLKDRNPRIRPQRRAEISVSGYTGAALNDFPVIVRVSPTRIPGFSYGDCAAGGADIAFVDADGNVLDREIDTWDPNGESLVWVSVPVLTNRATFAMTYKDPSAVAQPDCQTNGAVWAAAGYVGVWHFGEESGTAFDATANALHGSVYVPASQPASLADDCVGANAKVGKGRYTPAAVYFRLPNFSHLNVAGTLTLSGWYRMTETIPSNSSPMLFMAKTTWNSTTDGWYVCLQWTSNSNTTKTKLGMNGAGSDASVATVNSLSDWVHVTAVFNGAVGKAYSNGALTGTATFKGTATLTGVAKNMTVAKIPYMFGGNYAGYSDEVRLRHGVNDADWVKAEYDTVSSDAFLSYSQAERLPRHGLVIMVR